MSDDFKGDIFLNSSYLYILSVYVLLLFFKHMVLVSI